MVGVVFYLFRESFVLSVWCVCFVCSGLPCFYKSNLLSSSLACFKRRFCGGCFRFYGVGGIGGARKFRPQIGLPSSRFYPLLVVLEIPLTKAGTPNCGLVRFF